MNELDIFVSAAGLLDNNKCSGFFSCTKSSFWEISAPSSGEVVFTYCVKPRLQRPQVFYVVPPHDFHDFFSKFLQNKRSGEEVLCLHIVLPRLLRPLRPVGYHQFLMMLLPHDQCDCVLIAVVGSY